MTAIEGVDYSTARPDPVKLWAAGKRFVVRYGGPGSDAKHLHADELRGLRAAGLDVVANAEGVANGFRGDATGKSWARSALEHFNALGMPEGRPIYFSVDWGAGSGDWAGIDAALRGAASVIGADRVGVYGGYSTIAHCSAAKTARWFWQTYAWSNGQWHPAAHIQQYRNGVQVAGGDCDLNRAMQDDYGQWFGATTMAQDLTRDAVKAVWMTDGIIAAPPGAKNADGTPNEFWSPAYFLQYTLAVLGNMQKAIDGVPAQVVAQLTSPDTSVAEVAGLLKAALGDRAVPVGRILAGGQA